MVGRRRIQDRSVWCGPGPARRFVAMLTACWVGRGRAAPRLGVVFATLWIATGLAPTHLEAQDSVPVLADSVTLFTLSGEVRDATSDRPIIAAVVKVPELGRFEYAGVDGRFTFEDFPAGTWEFVIEQFGYHTSDGSVTVGPENGLFVRLIPDPVALAGFSVRSRSEALLADRRRRIPYRVKTMDAQMLAEAISGDPAQVFRRSSGSPVTGCDKTGKESLTPGCYWFRGRVRTIRVYLDEGLLLGGMEELSMHPADRLHLMEWVPRMGMLRVYSLDFVRKLDDSRMSLSPLVY